MKIGFIGGGKMAEAIVAALVQTGTAKAEQVTVADIDPARRERLQREYGVAVSGDSPAVAADAHVIILAVKPQVLDDVLAAIGPGVQDGCLVISIVAGKHIAQIASHLPGARIVRVMPNLPAIVSEGISAFCCAPDLTPQDCMIASLLLASFGRVVELPEEQFDAVTALSGSGPAFVARFIEAMIKGAQALGIEADSAAVLARQTVLGTAALLLQSADDEDAVVQSVSSPGGTTVAGRAVLEGSDFEDIVIRTLAAAANRSAELSGNQG